MTRSAASKFVSFVVRPVGRAVLLNFHAAIRTRRLGTAGWTGAVNTDYDPMDPETTTNLLGGIQLLHHITTGVAQQIGDEFNCQLLGAPANHPPSDFGRGRFPMQVVCASPCIGCPKRDTIWRLHVDPCWPGDSGSP
jgi:hypothetical protein